LSPTLSRALAALADWLAGWLARRSLATQSRIGAFFGHLMLLSGGMRNRLRGYLAQAGYGERVSIRTAAVGIGRMAVETAGLWRTPDATALARVRVVEGFDQVLAARELGRGVILLTPHMGSFEIVSLFIGSQIPLTVMFRPPRVTWADGLMRAGRDRLQIKSEPAEMSGIRAMLKALRRGDAIGLLPDQVPDPGKGGEGIWAPFFGRAAYTMTLVQKLARNTGALVLMVACVRLPKAAGYRVVFTALPPFADDAATAAAELNAAVEAAIALAPEQFLWSYNRYKVPAGTVPPDRGAAR
jgi:KDO2-lipid IV(A) lauroyltransferase